jgi:outer membrane immunogenic protein
MRSKIVSLLAAAFSIALIPAASAADMPTKAPAPMVTPMYNWSGWYVGFNAGAAVDPARFNTDPVFSPIGYFAATSTPAISATAAQSVHTPGFTGGIQFGYNWQMGNTLFGIEEDFNYMGLKGSTTNTALYPCCAPTAFTINQTVKTDWLWTLRPRLGWTSNNWLLYITGGLAVTQIKANFLFTDTFAAANESASINRVKAGWALGAGAEYGLLGGPWSVKAEYLHVDFGTVSTTSTNLTAFTPPIPFPSNVFTHSVRLSDDIVRVGLNYKVAP